VQVCKGSKCPKHPEWHSPVMQRNALKALCAVAGAFSAARPGARLVAPAMCQPGVRKEVAELAADTAPEMPLSAATTPPPDSVAGRAGGQCGAATRLSNRSCEGAGSSQRSESVIAGEGGLSCGVAVRPSSESFASNGARLRENVVAAGTGVAGEGLSTRSHSDGKAATREAPLPTADAGLVPRREGGDSYVGENPTGIPGPAANSGVSLTRSERSFSSGEGVEKDEVAGVVEEGRTGSKSVSDEEIQETVVKKLLPPLLALLPRKVCAKVLYLSSIGPPCNIWNQNGRKLLLMHTPPAIPDVKCSANLSFTSELHAGLAVDALRLVAGASARNKERRNAV
jgi:hypothetical protein